MVEKNLNSLVFLILNPSQSHLKLVILVVLHNMVQNKQILNILKVKIDRCQNH